MDAVHGNGGVERQNQAKKPEQQTKMHASAPL
jgi:hypothetical protein